MYLRADHPSDAAEKLKAKRKQRDTAVQQPRQQQQQQQPGPDTTQAAHGHSTAGKVKSKRKRLTRGVREHYDLHNQNASEARAMERAYTAMAVRQAIFLREVTATEAARIDATKFQRHYGLPGARRLGADPVPTPGQREWFRWQLLGLPPTGRTLHEWKRTRADENRSRSCEFKGSYGDKTETGELAAATQEQVAEPSVAEAGGRPGAALIRERQSQGYRTAATKRTKRRQGKRRAHRKAMRKRQKHGQEEEKEEEKEAEEEDK